jgi:hypothetical protein
MYSISQLVAAMRNGKNILQILNDSNFNISVQEWSLYPDQFQNFLDLIKIFKGNPRINVATCNIFDKLCAITSEIDNNQARQLVDIIIEENYDIETILRKIYTSDSIVNIINATYFEINYDRVFDEALEHNSSNRAIFEHIISNNCVDYNKFNYYDKNIHTAHSLDVLLTHGFDILKFPIDNSNVNSMLYDISDQNLKYFSCVKMDLSQYILITISMSDNRLKEFLCWYNIDNIIYPEVNNKVRENKINRAQILIDSGVNLMCILDIVVNAINDCNCDCLEH